MKKSNKKIKPVATPPSKVKPKEIPGHLEEAVYGKGGRKARVK